MIRLLSNPLKWFSLRAQATVPGPTDDYWYEPKSLVNAGQPVNGNTALTFSGCWAATNAIAGLFGALPCKSYRKTDEGQEEAAKHESFNIISREPNSDMDSFVFWEMMTQWWVNYGNAFAEIQRTGTGRLVALWPIHPSRVKPERNANKEWTGRWLVSSSDGRNAALDSDDMFNIVGNLSDDGIIGKGVVTYAAQAIGIGLAEGQYQGDFYGNGGRPSGTLEHPSKLSPEARDQLRREWRTVHGKSNEVAVLWEGMKFNPISVDPEHAQLIESRTFSVQEMSRFYDLPPHVLYELSNGTFANTEEMNRFLVSHSIGKRLVRVERAMDRQLFTPIEKKARYYTKFNVNALLRGNPKEQAEINKIKIDCGALNPDEWRAQDEQNKLPEGLGAHYLTRRDMAPLKLVVETKSLDNEPPQQELPKPGTPDTPPTPPTPAAKLEKLTELLAEKRSAVRRLASSLRDERGRVAEMDRDKEAVFAQFRRTKARMTKLKGRLSRISQEKLALVAENEQLTAQWVAVDKELEQVRAAASEDASIAQARQAELQSRITTLSESEAAMVECANKLQERILGQNDRIEVLHAEKLSLNDQKVALAAEIEAKATEIEALLAEGRSTDQLIASLNAKHEQGRAAVEELEGQLQEVQATLVGKAEALSLCEQTISELQGVVAEGESALKDAEEHRKAAVEGLNTKESELLALQAELARAVYEKEGAIRDLNAVNELAKVREQERAAESERVVNRANQRGDEYKAKCESLALESGALRAEREMYAKQVETITAVRDEMAKSVTAAEKQSAEARKRAETAENEAKLAVIAADSQLSTARTAVVASVRVLLDESLKFLLSQEGHEVKSAVRKQDDFRQIVEGYYHNFRDRLTAQLAQAAAAVAGVGGGSADAAKMAADYVAESRKRLNAVLNKTSKTDIRPAVYREVESWEDRRHALTNWIGG